MTERMESVVPRVELKGIRKSFPGVAALKNVDFTLMPNEVHGLRGENGAGSISGPDAGADLVSSREYLLGFSSQ